MTLVTCEEKECVAQVDMSHKWARIKAWGDGWYLSRDERTAWCPQHRPSWAPVRQR